MKSNKSVIFLGIILLCLCLFLSGIGLVYVYFRHQPPSTVTNDAGYYIRGSRVYYLGGFPSTAFEVQGADARSFQILDSQYAKDDSAAYFNGVIIPEANPATFEVLESWFSRDVNHVYISGAVFSDDPAHFEILGESLYRDSQHVYWSTNIISDDPASLLVLFSQDYYTYIKDSQNVFVNGNPIADADVDTFEVLSLGYAWDVNQVYYFDQILYADSTTFEILEIPYSRDSQHVFWMENLISGADSATFKVLNADFECSADSQRAYYQDQPISNFDPASIPADSQVTNCDSNGVYFSP